MSAAALVVGATDSIDTEVIEILGAVSAILATIGILLLLPIYIGHRREVERLLEWKERNPEAGTTEFRAVPGPTGPPRPSGGPMTPAERVTSERPALKRIATGEYEVIEPEPKGFWQRVIERGPRHPLVLTIIAILIGVAVVVVASQLIRSDDDGASGGGVDPADVTVAILNATPEPGVGNEVSDILESRGLTVDSNSAASDPRNQSGVFYGQGEKAKGRFVAGVLKLPRPVPFEQEEEAAADGADVVVVAGEDGRAVSRGASGDSGDISAGGSDENAPGEG